MKKLLSILSIVILYGFIISCGIQAGESTQTNSPPISYIPIISTVEVRAPESIQEPEPEPEPQPELISLGEFKLTAYCSCEKCCGKWAQNRPGGIVYGASGKELVPGYSIAVDPKVIPYGTIVEFNGMRFEAMDCGGAIKDNRIDVYFDNHTDALEFGVQYAEVFWVTEDTLNMWEVKK